MSLLRGFFHTISGEARKIGTPQLQRVPPYSVALPAAHGFFGVFLLQK